LNAAVREGSFIDALAAVKAAQRAKQADSDAPLLILADAFRRKKWVRPTARWPIWKQQAILPS
jgi:hypothetical protein